MSRNVLIAIALVATTSGSALAQNQSTFKAWGHTFDRQAAQAVPNLSRSYDELTTGSIYTRLGDRTVRSPRQSDRRLSSSAKEGNAENNNFLASNYGSTSGGPAY